MDIVKLDYWCDYEVEIATVDDHLVDYSFGVNDTPALPGELTHDVQLCKTYWLKLKVTTAEGRSWVGMFQPGPEGISGLYATPCSATLCVITKGQGYWIPTNDPDSYEDIKAFPIKKVFSIPHKNLMAFVDYTQIFSYGPNGLLWYTPDLSWDGLKITEVSTSLIKGVGRDVPNYKDVTFLIHTEDGGVEGGLSIAR